MAKKVTNTKQNTTTAKRKANKAPKDFDMLKAIRAENHYKSNVKRRDAGKCAVETNVIFVEMLWELEKLGDHLANIAMRTPKIQEHYVEME